MHASNFIFITIIFKHPYLLNNGVQKLQSLIGRLGFQIQMSFNQLSPKAEETLIHTA
jgi:hypothetical protein